mgnify:CR=1 FL=1
MFGSPPLNPPINNIGVKTVPTKLISHSQILLLPQTVPCPHCTIGVTILELVHRAPDGTVSCRRGHRFPITQVAQYFGRIDNVGTADEVDAKVKEWLDRPAPAAVAPTFSVLPIVLAAGFGIVVGIVLGWFIVYALQAG